MTRTTDRDLVRLYWPADLRPAFDALFTIDAAMADVLRTTSEPQLGEIRLAWWRERLEELDSQPPPAEPRLRAVATELISRGIAGREVATLANGWRRLFEPFPWDIRVAEALWFRGRYLFALGARILAQPDDMIEGAGGLWALVDAARHCSDAQSRDLLLERARTFARGLAGARVTPALRPLSLLGAVAIRDCRSGEPFETEGTPGRALAMARHRLTGRFPRI